MKCCSWQISTLFTVKLAEFIKHIIILYCHLIFLFTFNCQFSQVTIPCKHLNRTPISGRYVENEITLTSFRNHWRHLTNLSSLPGHDGHVGIGKFPVSPLKPLDFSSFLSFVTSDL